MRLFILFIMLLNFAHPSFAGTDRLGDGWGSDVQLTDDEIKLDQCLETYRRMYFSPEEALKQCEDEKFVEDCVKGLEEKGMDHNSAFEHCVDLLTTDSEFASENNTRQLNFIINNPDYTITILKAATAGAGAWSLMSFLQFLSKAGSRVANPALAFVPPALLEEFFAADPSKAYLLPDHPTLTLDQVREFLKKDVYAQKVELQKNPEMKRYLKMISDSIKKQDEEAEYNRTHLTA